MSSPRPRYLVAIAAAGVVVSAALAGAVAGLPAGSPPGPPAHAVAESAIARDLLDRWPMAPAFRVTCPTLPATIAHCSIVYADGVRVAASFDSRTGATGTGWWRD